MSRAQILEKFVGRKKLIGAIGESADADFIIVSGSGGAAGVLSYGDANKTVLEIGRKILAAGGKIPVLAWYGSVSCHGKFSRRAEGGRI